LKSEYHHLIKQYPDADPPYRLLYNAICNIEDLAGCTPAADGEIAEWTEIIIAAEDNRASYCKALSGSVPFSALNGSYTVALIELKSLLKASNSAGGAATGIVSLKPTQEDGFKEVRRRKRHSSNEAARLRRNQQLKPKTPPIKRSPRATSTLLSGKLLWTLILQVQRPLHYRRQSLVQQVDRPQ
jgi:hypothetical protein